MGEYQRLWEFTLEARFGDSHAKGELVSQIGVVGQFAPCFIGCPSRDHSPPWRKDAFYFTHRPLVADWHVPRYNAMTEWRQRIEALVGDVSGMNVDDNLAGEMDDRARDHYSKLSPADLSAIARRYGGNFLITEGSYDYPALFHSGRYTVYQLDLVQGGLMSPAASVSP